MPSTSIIIDSGATKSAWVCVRDHVILQSAEHPGIHPFFLDDQGLTAAFNNGKASLKETPEAIYYYGTGCKAPSPRDRVHAAIKRVFPAARTIEVNSDLLGAARALCQHSEGVACILGTGSNSAFYDGQNIIRTAGGLGFILGDEGSGADLGKAWISAWLYNETPKELAQQFADQFGLLPDEVIEAVYRKPFPSRYLARFAVFLKQHEDHPFVRQLIGERFAIFLRRHLPQLVPAGVCPVFFTGSISVHFADHLQAALREYGFPLGRIEGDPIRGLAVFHAG